MLIKDANRQRKETLDEQQEIQEIYGLYGREVYLQNEEDPIREMDIIFETWEDGQMEKTAPLTLSMALRGSHVSDCLASLSARSPETCATSSAEHNSLQALL